ncbi:MAG: hypothetical protein OXF30_01695 [Candidatus Saccharibacteria bacterium]|nr:hypothetical protein [Candidatus Saccharibacteria bacterium]
MSSSLFNLLRPKSTRNIMNDSETLNVNNSLPTNQLAQQLADITLNDRDQKSLKVGHLKSSQEFCKKLLHQAKSEVKILQIKWQEYYSKLNEAQKQFVWQYANKYFPEIGDQHDEKFINSLWSRVFGDENNLKTFTKGTIHNKPKHGLLYCYLVDGKVQYIGHTKENSLIKRFTKMHGNGLLGYKAAIKKRLLNAHRSGRLEIHAKLVKLTEIKKMEAELIRYHATSR